MLDSLDDLLFVFTVDGTLQYWDDAITTVTGYTSDGLPARPTNHVYFT